MPPTVCVLADSRLGCPGQFRFIEGVSCGRRLTGHVERYRHIEACEAFRAARPGGTDQRHKGDSYAAAVYDDIAPRALAHVVANAAFIAEVQDAVEDRLDRMSDQFRLARIRRERQQATRRLEADRDAAAWRETWNRLDREEAEATTALTPSMTAREIANSLADVQSLFMDAEPVTQHRILQALFEKVEVLGPNEVWLYPSVEAEVRGWAAAMSGEFRVEVRKTGRGERNCTSGFHSQDRAAGMGQAGTPPRGVSGWLDQAPVSLVDGDVDALSGGIENVRISRG